MELRPSSDVKLPWIDFAAPIGCFWCFLLGAAAKGKADDTWAVANTLLMIMGGVFPYLYELGIIVANHSGPAPSPIDFPVEDCHTPRSRNRISRFQTTLKIPIFGKISRMLNIL
jgi:hypothetical protein